MKRKLDAAIEVNLKELGMAGEWRHLPFGQLLTVPTRNGIHKGPAFQGRGVPVIKMGEIYHTDIVGSAERDRLELTAEELGRLEALEDDLLFCRTSLVAKGVGHCALVGKLAERTTFASNLIRARVDTKMALPRYWFYYFRSPAGNGQLMTLARGTSVTTITGPDIASLRVPVPSFEAQRAIAHILGTLDDKIELNHRMNETLEVIAQALFKSWFVDFDPVRAKAEGRDPGLPKPLADLLPDSFEDSELGEIPVGWEVRSLDEVAKFLNGLALQKYPPDDGLTLPVIKIAQLRKGDNEGADRCNTDLPPDYVIADGDVLFSWSGSLECVFWTGGEGALNQHLFKVTSEKFPKWFCYLWVHQHLPDFRHIAAGKATTMGHIQRHHLSDAKAVVPHSGVMVVADKIFAPLIEQAVELRVQSRTLAALRDTLLPKLISGEIGVKKLEGVEAEPRGGD